LEASHSFEGEASPVGVILVIRGRLSLYASFPTWVMSITWALVSSHRE